MATKGFGVPEGRPLPLQESFSPHEVVKKSEVYAAARRICEHLRSEGESAFFVGGVVRDFFLRSDVIPADIDIATSADPARVQELFPGAGFVGKAFGVSLVKMGGRHFEVTTFRREGKYSDRRHPDHIEKGSMWEDSCRRDFTINALYFDPVAEVITDFHGGLVDVHQCILRAVGRAQERFHEDALRIVRLFRFGANFDLFFDESTVTGAKEEADGLALLSLERIVSECVKVGRGKFACFAERFLGAIPPCFLNSTLPATVVVNSVGVQSNIPDNFHRHYPVTALICCILLGASDVTAQLQKVFSVFSSWPMSRQDAELLRALSAIACLEDYPGDGGRTGQLYWLYRTLARLRQVAVHDVRFVMACALQLSAIKEPLLQECADFLARIHDHKEGSEEWGQFVRRCQAAHPGCFRIKEMMREIDVRGLSKNYIGAWSTLQDAESFWHGLHAIYENTQERTLRSQAGGTDDVPMPSAEEELERVAQLLESLLTR